jgi:hypothetical protein
MPDSEAASTRSDAAAKQQRASELLHGEAEPDDTDEDKALLEQHRQEAAERHADPEDTRATPQVAEHPS